MSISPGAVEWALAINAFVCMPSKEISLSLSQVGGQGFAAVRIIVIERSRKSGARNAGGNAQSYNPPPRQLPLIEFGGEGQVDHEVGKVGIGLQCSLNLIQKLRTNVCPPKKSL